jgi:hypothetical protein
MIMHRPVTTPKSQGSLKQNFEKAIQGLRDEKREPSARHMPIAQRSKSIADPKATALRVASTALATLWGL